MQLLEHFGYVGIVKVLRGDDLLFDDARTLTGIDFKVGSLVAGDQAMVSYLQWGGLLQVFGIEEVAVSAGLWSRGSAIDEGLASNSIQLNSAQLQVGGRRADHFTTVSFTENSLAGLTPADLAPSDEQQDTSDDDTVDDRGGRMAGRRSNR